MDSKMYVRLECTTTKLTDQVKTTSDNISFVALRW